MDELNLRPEETQAALNRLKLAQDMQSHLGWRFFVEECEKSIENIKSELLTEADSDRMRFLQGQADQLDQLIHFEDTVDNMIEFLETQEEADADV